MYDVSFAHYFNNIVKPKRKTALNKMASWLYLLYISNIQHQKLRGLQNGHADEHLKFL